MNFEPCGWRVWQETAWSNQWIGMCTPFCPGGIRCNDRATAEAFKDQMSCRAEPRT